MNVIEAINNSLTNIGERPIINVENTAGAQAYNALRDSLAELQTISDWSWLHKTTGLTWTGIDNTATLPYQRIKHVFYTPPAGQSGYNTQVPFLDQEQFARLGVEPGRLPCWYTIKDSETLAFYPHPTDVDEQARVQAVIVAWVSLPTDLSSAVPVPDVFIELLINRASAKLAVRRLADVGLSQAFNNEFEVMAQRLRDRQRAAPAAGGTNMYIGTRSR